jgi:hypothetical protein
MVDATSGLVGLGAGALLGRFVLPQPEPFNVPVFIGGSGSDVLIEDVTTLLSAAGIEYTQATYELPVNDQLGLVTILQVRASDSIQAQAIVKAWVPAEPQPILS